jgi:hypothetical protein
MVGSTIVIFDLSTVSRECRRSAGGGRVLVCAAM